MCKNQKYTSPVNGYNRDNPLDPILIIETIIGATVHQSYFTFFLLLLLLYRVTYNQVHTLMRQPPGEAMHVCDWVVKAQSNNYDPKLHKLHSAKVVQ